LVAVANPGVEGAGDFIFERGRDMKLRDKVDRLVRRGVTPFVLAACAPLAALAGPPADAVSHGMTVNTFSSTFTAQTVDMNATLNRGYKWYLADMFGTRANPAGVRLNSDSSVTLLGDKTGAVGSLLSVAPYRGTNSYVGTAFGGGAYIEAVFNWDPAQMVATHPAGGPHYAYPSFWSLPMEGTIIVNGDQWVGQASGYKHNVEVDFFEADTPWNPKIYGVGMHDWYGIQNKTCNPGLCKISPKPAGVKAPPDGTNFKSYHTYGFLWVPATATSSGYVDAYFDGERTGYKVSWTQYTNQAPTPVGKTWAFGKTDQQHMFFILGTGVGETYQVKSVNVWQRNTSNNMTN
jgi:hypothetical protein